MIKDFLKQKCDIVKYQIVVTWWEETEKEIIIKSCIDCKLYSVKNNRLSNDISQNDSNISYKAIIQDICEIKQWYYLFLYDFNNEKIRYKIESYDPKYNIKWKLNHIELNLIQW